MLTWANLEAWRVVLKLMAMMCVDGSGVELWGRQVQLRGGNEAKVTKR